MDIVRILHDLWRARLFVVLVAIVALVAGVEVHSRIELPFKLESRQHTVGVATTRILVDTPSSQVVQVAPKGSDALGARATLLSNLMVDGEIKDIIAKRAHLASSQLGGVAEPSGEPAGPSVSKRSRNFMLSTHVLSNSNGDPLPVIELEAQAPTVAGATSLANAAVTGLREYLDSKAASERVTSADRLRVTGLGAPDSHETKRGPGLLAAVAVTIFVFGAGCAIIVAFLALARAWYADSLEARRRDAEYADVYALDQLFEERAKAAGEGDSRASAGQG